MKQHSVKYFFRILFQRHFCVLSVPPTTIDSMQTIFGLQLREHLRRIHPPSESQEEVEEFRITAQQQIVRLAISLQSRMSGAFHPTALKFHYVFNLRDISNVFRVSTLLIQVYMRQESIVRPLIFDSCI